MDFGDFAVHEARIRRPELVQNLQKFISNLWSHLMGQGEVVLAWREAFELQRRVTPHLKIGFSKIRHAARRRQERTSLM